MTDDQQRFDELEIILAGASKLALDWFSRRPSLEVQEKEAGQYVSQADHAVEREIRSLVSSAFPTDNVMGEEEGGALSGTTWVIDPIDGTSNFLNGIPLWGVSIGLMRDQQSIFGGIALPAMNRMLMGGMSFPAKPSMKRRTPPVPTIAIGWNASIEPEEERRQINSVRRAV